MIGPVNSGTKNTLCPYCGQLMSEGELISEHDSRFVYKPKERFHKKVILKSRTLFTSVCKKARRCPNCKIIVVYEE